MTLPVNTQSDQTEYLLDAVQTAISSHTPLQIVGGDTKHFYLRRGFGDILSVSGHVGVLDYEPTELVLTARAGTPLTLIEPLLEKHGQMLPFDPPHFGEGATLGGVVASGLSGPRRPYGGSVRDHLLGVTFINGLGHVLKMGGKVMKNVAGFDVARLMAGSLGTLGVLLDVSVRVSPRPEFESTRVFECDADNALRRMSELGSAPMPITGMCHVDGRLFVRVSGGTDGVIEACKRLGGDEEPGLDQFWADMKEQRTDFFTGASVLWRLSVEPFAEQPQWLSPVWIDWGGAQRWVSGCFDENVMMEAAGGMRGHALVFRAQAQCVRPVLPMTPALSLINRRIKSAFDPHGLFLSRVMFSDA